MLAQTAVRLPPSSNTGGKSHLPPVVSLDWLSFSWAWDRLDARGMAGLLSAWVGSEVLIVHTGHGYMGFTSRADIQVCVEREVVSLGLMAWGGEAQNGRALVSLTGKGCASIPAHRLELVQRALEKLEARITRVDLAADDLEGKFSVDLAAEWYLAGDFNAGGAPPSHKTEGGWLQPDGTGRTLYVGKASNGKGLCVYEKGKQLGDANSPWVRWELRLMNRDRVIPYELLTRTEHYFAGGYPCLARVVKSAALKVKTVKLQVEKSLSRLVTYARSSYGRLIHVMLAHSGGDFLSVVQALRLPGVPASLASAWMAQAQMLPGFPQLLGGKT